MTGILWLSESREYFFDLHDWPRNWLLSSLADHRLGNCSQLFISVQARFQIYYESKLNSASDFQHLPKVRNNDPFRVFPSIPVKYVEIRIHGNIIYIYAFYYGIHYIFQNA